ncbi:MAG: transcription antitermination factor NusB [Bacteroidota bacterium]
MNRDSKLHLNGALDAYRKGVLLSYELFLFNLLLFIKVAGYAKEDAKQKSSKLLPTEEDKKFTDKLSSNQIVETIRKSHGFQTLVKHYALEDKVDEDGVRRVYQEFAKEDSYKAYVGQETSMLDDHKAVLLALYKFCINSETFNDLLEDNFALWVDDKSLVVGATKKTIKALPDGDDFYEKHRPGDETTKEFGEVLLSEVCQNDSKLLALIEPTLKNWDVERVAVIDMILLKMALCELLQFPTIPTKVTLNEFVDISKQYSTDKSKDFINGILDRLMKKLHKEGQINKKGRGLVE